MELGGDSRVREASRQQVKDLLLSLAELGKRILALLAEVSLASTVGSRRHLTGVGPPNAPTVTVRTPPNFSSIVPSAWQEMADGAGDHEACGVRYV